MFLLVSILRSLCRRHRRLCRMPEPCAIRLLESVCVCVLVLAASMFILFSISYFIPFYSVRWNRQRKQHMSLDWCPAKRLIFCAIRFIKVIQIFELSEQQQLNETMERRERQRVDTNRRWITHEWKQKKTKYDSVRTSERVSECGSVDVMHIGRCSKANGIRFIRN